MTYTKLEFTFLLVLVVLAKFASAKYLGKNPSDLGARNKRQVESLGGSLIPLSSKRLECDSNNNCIVLADADLFKRKDYFNQDEDEELLNNQVLLVYKPRLGMKRQKIFSHLSRPGRMDRIEQPGFNSLNTK